MTPTRHTIARVQAGSLATLDITPSVLFVALEAAETRVKLRHPNGATLIVPVARVRPMMRP